MSLSGEIGSTTEKMLSMIFPKIPLGEPRYSRCLTDKILAAFIQA